MTKPEFLQGYLLLTTQPWGKPYRTMQQTPGVAPEPAELQAELYYRTVEKAHPDAWVSACVTHAAGDHWPSLDALQTTMKTWKPAVESYPALHAPTPVYLTKEEFGINLFEVIQTISGMRTIRQQLNTAVHQQHAKNMARLTAHYQEARTNLANQLTSVTEEEMQQILAHYPHVASL